MENQKAMPFSMPMFRDFVPRRIQPWIYVVTVLCIQFSGGVYLGALEAVRGTTGFMIEDLLMLLYAGLAGASGYGLYTTLFQHFMADNMSRYGAYLTLTGVNAEYLSSVNDHLSTLSTSVMSVTLKQIFGQIIWVSAFMTFAFLLLDIPRVRTGIEKVPYWPVYGIKLLSRLR